MARRGKSLRTFNRFSTWDRELVLLVSHFMFDGEIKHGGCSYNNRNLALLNRVEAGMKRVYIFEPKRYKNAITGVIRISYFNVALSAFMREKANELLDRILKSPKDLKREFIRAFFDDEGCMDYRPSRNLRRVRGYQKETDVLYLVQKLLQDFEIQSSFKKPNEIVIAGKDNLMRFREEIGFSRGVRINGYRSNSLWKESLEKRTLLDRAIRSYKPIGSNGVHRAVSRD